MNTFSDCQEDEHHSFALPFGGVFQWVARGIESVVRAYEGRQVLRQLANSDDRMLKDIGLSRYEVEMELRRPWWRR